MSAVLFLCLSNWVCVSVLLLGRSLRPVSGVLVCVYVLLLLDAMQGSVWGWRCVALFSFALFW